MSRADDPLAIWAFIYQMTIGACGYSVAAEIPSSRLRSATIGMAQATAQVASWGMGFATPYVSFLSQQAVSIY